MAAPSRRAQFLAIFGAVIAVLPGCSGDDDSKDAEPQGNSSDRTSTTIDADFLPSPTSSPTTSPTTVPGASTSTSSPTKPADDACAWTGSVEDALEGFHASLSPNEANPIRRIPIEETEILRDHEYTDANLYFAHKVRGKGTVVARQLSTGGLRYVVQTDTGAIFNAFLPVGIAARGPESVVIQKPQNLTMPGGVGSRVIFLGELLGRGAMLVDPDGAISLGPDQPANKGPQISQDSVFYNSFAGLPIDQIWARINQVPQKAPATNSEKTRGAFQNYLRCGAKKGSTTIVEGNAAFIDKILRVYAKPPVTTTTTTTVPTKPPAQERLLVP